MKSFAVVFAVLFDCFDSYRPIQHFIQLCRDVSSWVEPVLSRNNCILLNDTTSAAGKARTRNHSISSQALYHWATELWYLQQAWFQVFLADSGDSDQAMQKLRLSES